MRHKEYNLKTFKLAIDFASDHIVIADIDGKILYANKAVERITGFSKEEIIGNYPSLWGGQMDKKFYKKFWKTIKTDKKSFIGEIKNKRKNGELYTAEIRVSPILDEKNNIIYFVGIERDITKEKEIDKAKSEFIFFASHQLKNPLTAIIGYLNILLSKKNLSNEKRLDYYGEMHEASRRMTELVNAFLNVAKIESDVVRIKKRKVDVTEIFDKAIHLHRLQIEKKKIMVKKNFSKDMVLETDANLFRVIMQNLISNAVKYLQDKGTLNIEITRLNKEMIVKIGDNGPGIPKKDQGKIFSKLYRASNVEKISGSGLGLYIVKTLVDKLGGEISFDSEKSKGTTFTVKL